MYSLHVLVESGVLQAIVKLRSRVGQQNPLYVIYTIYDLSVHGSELLETRP